MTTSPQTTTKTRYLSVTDTAKLVREQLKATFPGQKFSVRVDKYAGGASIDVSWTDGPAEEAVEAVTKRYESRWFDGMTDSTHYYEPTLMEQADGTFERVHFGSHHVMSHRKLSEGYLDQLEKVAVTLVDQYTSDPFGRDKYYDAMHTEWGYTPHHGTGHSVLWWLSKHVAPEDPGGSRRTPEAPARKRSAK